MKTRLLPFALTGALLLVTCGCQTGPQVVAAPPPVSLADRPILFLPVLPMRADLAEAADAMNRDLREEATARLGSRALFAEDLSALRNALEDNNLQQDGTLNLSEIATLADVAECGTAFVLALSGNDPYMPQSLTGNAILIDTKTTRVAAERLVSLRLSDPRVLATYRHYLENTRTFRVGNLESDAADRLHTALLSPTLFRRFASYAIMADLFSSQRSSRSIQLRPAPVRQPWLLGLGKH